MRVLLSIMCCIAVAACAGPVRTNDKDEVKAAVKTTRDENRKAWLVSGPNVSTREGRTGVLEAVALDAILMDNGSVTYSLHIVGTPSLDQGPYAVAYDADGERFTLETGRSSGHFSTPITSRYLTRHLSTGINMKVVGPGFEEKFSIPKSYIAGFLNGVWPLVVGQLPVIVVEYVQTGIR